MNGSWWRLQTSAATHPNNVYKWTTQYLLLWTSTATLRSAIACHQWNSVNKLIIYNCLF